MNLYIFHFFGRWLAFIRNLKDIGIPARNNKYENMFFSDELIDDLIMRFKQKQEMMITWLYEEFYAKRI